MAIYSIHVWYVNRTLLPKELQAPAWRHVVLRIFSGFFAFSTLVAILNRVFGIKIG